MRARGFVPVSSSLGARFAGAFALAVPIACGGASASPTAKHDGLDAAVDPLAYLDDASVRRQELVASLVNPSNDYSSLRLAYYASGNAGDWDLLPEWNPAAEVVGAGELDAPGGAPATTLSPAAVALALPAAVSSIDDPALLALGKAAFFTYPTQLAQYFSVALGSRAAAARYGLWVDDAHGVGGLVRARMTDGSVELAVTCATCHALPSASAIAPGLPNALLDVGSAILDAGGGPPAVGAWGPGRVDVTTSEGTEPARIPDLRPVRWLTHLQQDATVRQNDIVSLAIRIETLIITSNDEVVRPPRIVTLALAAYVMSLADGLPSTDTAAAASPEGAKVFAAQCTACHETPGFTGPPVPLATVGTDPTLGDSKVRGTGAYRVPSLHGVGTRGPLLHDGTVPSVDAMFDPSRPTASFTARLHGSGAVPGHLYGLDLGDAGRAALIGYLDEL